MDKSFRETTEATRARVPVSVIMCALNEEESLPHVLPRIPDYVHEVILVDGRSTDMTIEVARALRPDINVIVQDGAGRGNAIMCGVRAASGDYCLFLDADGSQRPEELEQLLSWMEQGYDIVKGSRFLPGGRSKDETTVRRLCIRLACKVANLLWRTSYTDVAYGLCLAKRDRVLALNLTARTFDFEWELAAKAFRTGVRIREVPSEEEARVGGRSKLSVLRHSWVIAKRVFVEFFAQILGRQCSL